MSVDYDANFGIGYEVEASSSLSQEELQDGMAEYLDINLGDEFMYFEVGAGSYTGEPDESFVVVKDAFKDGLNLNSKKQMLDDELKRLRLKPIGEFGDVGGLLVW